MSYEKELRNLEIFLKHKKKSKQILDKDIIIYRENIFYKEFESLMISGYKEMATINLELAQIDEEDIANVIDYETWLSGV
ncbi:MAG: hypothetical protein ACRC7N_06350 [Clostridium sp.]